MPSSHLTPMERGQLEALRNQGLGVRAIARELNRCHSTVCRELRRNSGGLPWSKSGSGSEPRCASHFDPDPDPDPDFESNPRCSRARLFSPSTTTPAEWSPLRMTSKSASGKGEKDSHSGCGFGPLCVSSSPVNVEFFSRSIEVSETRNPSPTHLPAHGEGAGSPPVDGGS